MVQAIVTSLSNVDNMKTAFPALNSLTAATSAQLAHYLEGAAMEVIAKLSKRYTIPVTQANNDLHIQLSNITTRLALQGYLEERAFMQTQANQSEFPQEFDKVRDLLDEIADGAIPLINNDGTIVAAKSTGDVAVWSNTSGYLPTFTEDNELRHEQDEDKIDDLRNDRV